MDRIFFEIIASAIGAIFFTIFLSIGYNIDGDKTKTEICTHSIIVFVMAFICIYPLRLLIAIK